MKIFDGFRKKQSDILAEREAFRSAVVQLVEKYGGSVQEYKYDAQCFGNLLLVIHFCGKTYRFVQDRGLAFCEIFDERTGSWNPFDEASDSHDFLATVESVLRKTMRHE